MSIKRWAIISVAAITLATCSVLTAHAGQKEQEESVAYCTALGNLSIRAIEFKAQGIPLDEALTRAIGIFEGEELRHVAIALKAGYTAKATDTDMEVGTAVFQQCMLTRRLSKI